MNTQHGSTLALLGALLGSTAVQAAPPLALLETRATLGEYQVTDDSDQLTADVEMIELSGRWYATEAGYLSLGWGTGEMRADSLTVDQTVTQFGGGFVIGERVDLTRGQGLEHRLGLMFDSTTLSAQGLKMTAENTLLSYAVDVGLGQGLVGGFQWITDTDSLFSANALSLSLTQAITDQLFLKGSYDFRTSEDIDQSLFSVGLGIQI